VNEKTLALFIFTKYYKVFTEVMKKSMYIIGCHKRPADRELTLEPVEYMENSIQYIGAGGICGAHPTVLTFFFPSSSCQIQTNFC